MRKVILALSFGKPADISPNRTIACLARKLSGNSELPIVADRSIPLENSIQVNYIGEEAEVHVSTLKLMEEFLALALKYGWDEVTMVSEPSYLKRCERDLKRVLKDNGRLCEISLYAFVASDDSVWFDKQSDQWWIRSRRLFRLREALIMALPWFLYKFIS